ncbi:PREDICTED: DNA repair protein XRCC1 [Drosophila arizonae]|uniref:DNA repair protein XRCC1 n=1 Tax=Drosophila arizonae TaxID=7263 RepID=A0ABM1PSW3_DROAR|nr:PREDICTED: DNA repair protein XRCC1 [Drosophila arizonae]
MPIEVFKSVREVSSEDAVHVAANLLKENAAKKWKTQAIGEKSAHVILEFEEPQQITGIDIGNEHSAFIEVLVSKTGCQPDDFRELLLSSSFMTPIESKNSSNTNRVRCFSSDALCQAALTDKWKLVKIVCTQPFNKHVQYGLSFVKMHVAGSAKPKCLVPDKFKLTAHPNPSPSPAVAALGRFKLREESPDSEPDGKASLSLFQRWKATRNEDTSTAAAIRDAGSPAALRRLSDSRPAPIKTPTQANSPSSATQAETKVLDRNRDSLLFGDDEDEDNPAGAVADARKQRLSKHIEADKNRRRMELEKELEKKKNKGKRLSTEKPAVKQDEQPEKKVESKPTAAVQAQKRLSSSLEEQSKPAKKPKMKEPKYVPFNQLLRGVVLVISGIQNPDRADLRSKAIALGAKYKADWEPGCTHLICAFRNTPKYNQVKGHGKIVTRRWIEKCYELKKYLPWRRFALDNAEMAQPESDEELYDESLKPTVDDDDQHDKAASPVALAERLDNNNRSYEVHSSGPDTEDELERVAQEKKKLKQSAESNGNKSSSKSKSLDVYEVSTDEEDYLQEKRKQL